MKLFQICLITFLTLFTVLETTKLTIFNERFYIKDFSHRNLYDSIPEANIYADNLIKYFNGKQQLANIYTERETKHLADVKFLFSVMQIIISISAAAALAILATHYYKKRRITHFVITSILWAGIASAAFIVMLMLAVSINFNSAFTIFHRILFINDLWMLPANSLLIRMFPEEFFKRFTRQIITNVLIISALLISVGVAYTKLYKHHNHLLNDEPDSNKS